MTDQQKLSRRDAIKILGAAAGASLMVNLPSKWSHPEVFSGIIPAHAQTSNCLTVHLEVLSADGEFGIDFYEPPVLPWSGMGDGGPGSTLTWTCQTGCLGFTLFLDTATKGKIQITINSQTFTLDFNGKNPYHNILIDLDSGEYDIDYENQDGAGSCSWPLTPVKQKFSNEGGTFWQK